MTEDSKKLTLPEFLVIAEAIAERPAASRSGFGAFRKWDKLGGHTIQLILRSGLFTPPRIGDGPYWPSAEYWYHHAYQFGASRVRFFKDVLSIPSCYDPV